MKRKKTLTTKTEIKTATKAGLKAEQDKIVKLQIYNLSLFIDQIYFNNDRAQLYLIFQPIYKIVASFSYQISELKSKGLSNEKFAPPYTADKSLSPKLIWNKSKIRFKFEESCLKQEDKTPSTPKNVVSLFIVYDLDTWSRDLNTDFTLKDCLFGAVKLSKNPDPDTTG